MYFLNDIQYCISFLNIIWNFNLLYAKANIGWFKIIKQIILNSILVLLTNVFCERLVMYTVYKLFTTFCFTCYLFKFRLYNYNPIFFYNLYKLPYYTLVTSPLNNTIYLFLSSIREKHRIKVFKIYRYYYPRRAWVH